MDIDRTQDKIFVETLDGIENPIVRGDVSLRTIFENVKEAQALWILPLNAREPYRVTWRQILGWAPENAPSRKRPPKKRTERKSRKERA